MKNAIVAITSDVGKENEVMGSMCKIEAVRECYVVYGVYDVIAKVQATSSDELSSTISSIRELPGVRSTLTLVVCKEHKK